MVRRILTILLFICVISGIVYLFNYYQRARKPVREAIACIPSDAVLILESRKVRSTCQKLRQANQMWEELKVISAIRDLHSILEKIDSIFTTVSGAAELLEDRPFYVSLHLRADGKTAFLFSYALPEMNKDILVRDLFSSYGSIPENTHEGFNGIAITEVRLIGSPEPFYFTINQGVLSGSFSKALVNEAILHSETGLPLTEDPSFSKVFSSAGERSDGNLYLRIAGMGSLYNIFRSTESEEVKYLSRFGTWSALDISMQTNLLTLNGYTASGSDQKLSSFLQQEPQELNILGAIPVAATEVVAFGIGDMSTYLESIQREGSAIEEQSESEEVLSILMNELGINPQQSFLGWTNNEFAGFKMPEEKNEKTSWIGIFHAPEEELARHTLLHLVHRVDSLKKERTDSVMHEGIAIYQLHCVNPIGVILREPLEKLRGDYFFIFHRHVYFGDSPSQLKKVISDLQLSLTLERDPGFRSFFRENFSPASNIFLYASVPTSLAGWSEDCREDLNSLIRDHQPSLKKFDAFAVQLTADKELFYSTVLLRFNPSAKKEITSIWETELANEVSGKPTLLLNHMNGTRDVFIQDDSSVIYLISNSGKILWKKELKEQILGQPVQIDVYQNNKLQIVFTTPSALHLLDRNGNTLPGFPVQLPSRATAAVSVFDYDKKEEYRFVIPLENKCIVNYSVKGKISEKWKNPVHMHATHLPIKHVRTGSKDYLILIDDAGTIVIYNRRGEKTSQILSSSRFRPAYFAVQNGKDLRSTTVVSCDTTGTISRTRLDGKKESFKLIDYPAISGFAFADIDLDGREDYLITHDSTLFSFSSSKKLLGTSRFASAITHDPLYFHFPGDRIVCGVSLSGLEKLSLVNPQGETLLEMSFKGRGPFAIGDLNKDNRFYLVSAGKDKRVYAWPIRSNGNDLSSSH